MKHYLHIFFVFFISIQLSAQSIGGNTSGSTAFCDTTNSGFISLTAYTGTIQYWEYSINNGANWGPILNPTPTQNYSHLTQTTWYRAIVKNGAFLPDTSTISIITIHQDANGGNIVGGGSFCQTAPTGTLNLNNQIGQVSFWEYSINGGSSWTIITNTLSTLPYTTITQNTLYRAIIQNILSCPNDTSTVASFIISQNTIAGILQQSDTVCYGNNFDTLVLSGQAGTVVDWIYSSNAGVSWNSLGYSSSTYTYSNIIQTTQYAVVIKNGSCLADTTQSVNIVVVSAIPANAGSDKTITQYESIQLDGNGIGTPQWTPNIQLTDQNIFTPTASPLHTLTYVLTITDQHSCSSSDSVVVNVIVPLPSAITPNGDGVNDYFLIDKIDDYQENTLQIFNRWGNLVYKESPYKNDWNGKSKNGHDLPDEVYYYTLDYGNGDKPISGYILIKR